MKSLGARSGQIIKIYLLQTLLLGLFGGLLGVALGVGVQLTFPYFLAKLINVDTELHVQFRTILTGLATGVLTTAALHASASARHPRRSAHSHPAPRG